LCPRCEVLEGCCKWSRANFDISRTWDYLGENKKCKFIRTNYFKEKPFVFLKWQHDIWFISLLESS
jgi:hypothetical protein